MAIELWESMSPEQKTGFLFSCVIAGGFLVAMVAKIIEEEMALRKKPEQHEFSEPTVPQIKSSSKLGGKRATKKRRGKVQWL